MKNKNLVISIYAVILSVYGALTLLLTNDKDITFWIGFGFIVFALISSAVITILSSNVRSRSFPIEVSIIYISNLYVIVAFVVNIVFDSLLHLEYKSFLSLHIVCLAIIVIIILLMIMAKGKIENSNTKVNGAFFEVKILEYEFEKIRIVLEDLPQETKTKAINAIDDILKEIKFSDFSAEADVSELDCEIRQKAANMLLEAHNLVQIQADDISAFLVDVSEIKQLVKSRNIQIRILNS